MKFEYDVVSLRDSTLPRILDIINEFGKVEWELVAVDNGIAYFKRPNREYINKIIKDQMGTNPAIIPQDESQK